MARILKDYLMHPALIIFISACITSCSTIQQNPGNKPVRLVFYNEINLATSTVPECEYKGPIVGSDGHWYNYLFIANEDMTMGAINDLYNQANLIGVNTIYVNNNIDFATSVTLLGQAYDCKSEPSGQIADE